MARGRKKVSIRNVKFDEQNVLKALWRVGILTKSDFESRFNVSSRRFQAFIKDEYFRIDGDIIRLGEKGIKYCTEDLKMEHRYRTTLKHLKHDLKLSKAYLQLPDHIKETWRTEGQLYWEVKDSKEYKELMDMEWSKNRRNFVPDAAIYSEKHGGYVAFECITSSYSKQDILQKEMYASAFLKGIYRF